MILISGFIAVISTAVMVAMYIGIMIYGWGIDPQSWWIIILGNVGVVVISSISQVIIKVLHQKG